MSAITYFCLDIEASGPVPGLFNMVSLGVVPVRVSPTGHVISDEELYLEIKPIFPGFDPSAMKIHGLTREHLDATGVEPNDAMQQLADWVKAQTGKTRPQFVGHNAPFDWMHIAYYFAHAGMANPFGYNAIDTKSLAMGVFSLPWRDTNKEKLSKLLPNLPPHDPKQVHNAVYDARFQAHILGTTGLSEIDLTRRGTPSVIPFYYE